MTDDVRGSGPPPASDGPPGPGVSIANGAEPAVDQSFDGDSLYAVRATVAAHASEAGMLHINLPTLGGAGWLYSPAPNSSGARQWVGADCEQGVQRE